MPWYVANDCLLDMVHSSDVDTYWRFIGILGTVIRLSEKFTRTLVFRSPTQLSLERSLM